MIVYPMLAPRDDLKHRIIVPDEPDFMDDDTPARDRA
jgi:AGZA family xanthine/uracil permease-like MFS transporter